jgi:hypothetical protein
MGISASLNLAKRNQPQNLFGVSTDRLLKDELDLDQEDDLK